MGRDAGDTGPATGSRRPSAFPCARRPVSARREEAGASSPTCVAVNRWSRSCQEMDRNTPLTDFGTSRAWAAKWIWHEDAPARNAWVLFRRECEVDSPEGARLFISADTRYRVWVNGQLLGDGPVQSQPYHQYYDERDVSQSVRPGTNCIAVAVHHQGVQPSTRGGLVAEIVDGDGRTRCATSSDWRAVVSGAWRRNSHFNGMNKIGPFQEHVDLRRMPLGWKDTGFDDSSWQAPHVIAGRGAGRVPGQMPWCRMIPRDIRFLEEEIEYAKAIQTAEECLDLVNRRNSGDLSVSLSQVGRPVDWARIEGGENLLKAEGETLLACSSRHRDLNVDGRYDPCLTLDFGRVITGYAELEVEAPAGALIEIGYAERLVDDRFNNNIECPFADCATFAPGVNVFRPLVWRSFRYLRLRLKHCEAGLKLRAARAIKVRYPYDRRGVFEGPERMEKVFDICRTTIELCSIESLMDTPFREQAQWLGDVAAVTVPGILACFGDTALPGKFLRQAAANTRPTGLLANLSNIATGGWEHDIPDYSLWWVIALWRYHEYTGDGRYLHECYPEMQRVMRTHLEKIGEDGLIADMFGWVFIDWAHVDKRGRCAPYNAIFAGACDAAADVARFKNDSWAAERYEAAARGVRDEFAATFIDPETGAVVDAVDDGKRSERTSEQANASAIAFDCVDGDAADRIIKEVFEKRSVAATEAQPFFMVVVLKALRMRARTDLALRLIDERWGRRMVDRGYASCSEEWYINGSWRDGDWKGFERTLSHAWSAGAAEFLITGLAGIDILEPGCAKLRVRPYEADFPYRVVYPTPRGDVSVSWDGTKAIIDAPPDVALE